MKSIISKIYVVYINVVQILFVASILLDVCLFICCNFFSLQDC